MFLMNSGKLPQAIKVYEQLMEEIKTSPSNNVQLSAHNLTYELILAYFDVKNFAKCVSLFTSDVEKGLAHSPMNHKLKYRLSIAELNTNKNWAKAHKYLSEIEKSEENKDNIKLMLVAVNYRCGDFSECERIITKMETRDEELEIYLIASRFWLNYAEFNEVSSRYKLVEYLKYIDDLKSTNEFVLFYKNFAKYEFESVLNENNSQEMRQTIKLINSGPKVMNN